MSEAERFEQLVELLITHGKFSRDEAERRARLQLAREMEAESNE